MKTEIIVKYIPNKNGFIREKTFTGDSFKVALMKEKIFFDGFNDIELIERKMTHWAL